jgi:AraC family transcriptional regulator
MDMSYAPAPSIHPGTLPRALTRVTMHVEQNLGQKLTLASLAAVACMSRFHFARLFRRNTGQSPMSYIARVRIERAKTLLALGQYATSDIAVVLGFCDQSHFTRVFRRITGLTPRAYARSIVGQAEDETPREMADRFDRDRFAATFGADAIAAHDAGIDITCATRRDEQTAQRDGALASSW